MTARIQRIALALALAAGAAVLAGCAAPAQKESMAPVALVPAKKHPFTVRVEPRGGAETGAMDSSNVSNADLKAAIEAAIANRNCSARWSKARAATTSWP